MEEELEVRKEYIKKLEKIKKRGYGKIFTFINELRERIEEKS